MINLWMPIYNLVCKRATVMLLSFFDWFNILPPFTYEKVEKWNKIGTILMRDVLWTLILKRTSLNNISFTLKEANDFVKNIISGQNGVFVIFNKRRNRIGKPMMRCNFENTQSKYNKEWFILLRLIFLILPTTNGLPMRFLTLCILTNKLIWPLIDYLWFFTM